MSKVGPRLVIIFARLGPYHVARLPLRAHGWTGTAWPSRWQPKVESTPGIESRQAASVAARVIAHREYQDVPGPERGFAVYEALETNNPQQCPSVAGGYRRFAIHIWEIVEYTLIN
jgi:hypothetical protein